MGGKGISGKKIAVCGKGGSGKSTVVTLLAGAARDRGYRVLVVDSDESNPGLYRILGFDERPEPLLGLVGGKKKVFETFSEGAAPATSVLTREEVHTRDLEPPYVVDKEGIKLVSVGKILQSLEGCACPMGALSREFLSRLSPEEDEVALVDMEAGIEHFGRGVESGVDGVLAVAEPSYDSLELAKKISSLATEVGIKTTRAILSKVSSEGVARRLREELEAAGVPVVGSIRYDPEILEAGFEGRPIGGDRAGSDVQAILDELL